MKKRLILSLALAFVLAASVAAYAEVSNVKVGGDLTVIGLMREFTLNNGQPAATSSNDKYQTIIGITRVRVDAELTDNVMATVRLLNERYWGTEDETTSDTDLDLDLAYITLKEFLADKQSVFPMTLVVGRQELRYGNGMIVGDATQSVSPASDLTVDPDLSVRKSFDAVKAILNYDPLVIDLVAAKVEETTGNIADDKNLYGINASYLLNKDKNTVVEGYVFEKYTQRKSGEQLSSNKPSRVDTIGARVATQLTDVLSYQLEGAVQLGKGVIAGPFTATRKAYALETAIGMDWKEAKYMPSAMVCYAFFSGQKANDKKVIRAWDPMFEDQSFGDIAGALFPLSNAHIFGLNGAIKPADDLTLKAEYYAFWWDKTYNGGDSATTLRTEALSMKRNKLAAQEIDVRAIYNYTEDVQFNLLSGILFPGASIEQSNDCVATEVVGSMKVIF